MIFRFNNPYILLLLLLLPIVYIISHKRKKTAVPYSDTTILNQLPKSLKSRLTWLPNALRYLGLICLIVAAARPQAGIEMERRSTSGIAIEVAIDRSGSMRELLLYKGKPVSRLAIVKAIFEEFALGSKVSKLKGRPDDLIGMVTFARYARTVCPLTLAHQAIPHILKNIHLAQTEAEDGTAIGDALALAAARLKRAEDTINKQGGDVKYSIKSKIIILLTDGQNNVGTKAPMDAAELAAKWGIKIYTVGIGGSIAAANRGFFGSMIQQMSAAVDTRSLRAIAAKTNGKFYMSEDVDSLRKIYQDIDKLEKTEFKATQSVTYHELFFNWALAGLIFLFLEILLGNTYLRRIP